MSRALVLLAGLAASSTAWGCAGPGPGAPAQDPGQPAPAADDEDEAAAARRRRELTLRGLARLLPIDRQKVLWFDLRRAGRERALPVALLPAAGPGGRAFLASAGLGRPGDPPLRLWRTDEEVWVLPGGALGPEVDPAPYRAWTVESTWDDRSAGRGRRGSVEGVQTPLGTLRALRTEHTRGDVTIRHHFAEDRGLVRLEVLVAQQTTLSLELVEVAPRGRPRDGYDLSTPDALWSSVEEAVRGADVGALERLLSASLRRRARTSAWDRVRDLAAGPPGEDPLLERALEELGDLLRLEVRLRGAWVVSGDEAVAPAFVNVDVDASGRRSTARAQLVLRRQQDGTWRWDDVRT